MTERSGGRMIVFVCTGNICRSPMAEYLLRRRLEGIQGVRVKSAGIMALRGQPASPEAVTAMKEVGVDLTPHKSQPLTWELVDEADLIVVMTSAHLAAVQGRFPDAMEKTRRMMSFSDMPLSADVADPIGLSVDVYRRTRDQIDSAIADLILDIRERGWLSRPAERTE